MATKENYKKLQENLQQFEERNKAVYQNLQKLEKTTKEKDAKTLMEDLEGQLKTAVENMLELEEEVKEVQEGITRKLGKKTEADKKRAPLKPEEQELTYELKAQLMKNVEMQNHKLKTEFTLHEKMAESRLLSQQNKRLTDDVMLTRANSLRLIKMFEKKAKQADVKLKEMKLELTRTHDLADKYKMLYELERRKTGDGKTTEPDVTLALSPEVEAMDGPKPHPTSYSFLGQSTRINDIIRKNEVLVEESGNLKREIKRLKADNDRLVRQTKQAMSERDNVLHRLETSESNRKNLMRRLDKERLQHTQLSRSLTRQASDWILLKKQIAQFDEEYRWSQVGPVNPQSSEERFRTHPVTKNVYMPRKMYPVEEYGKTTS